MTDKIVAILLFIVGIVNIIPITVFFAPSKMADFYGVSIEGDSLMILMRHRGILLGLVGAILIYSAFKREFRVVAVSTALVSKFAFLFLTLISGGDYSPEIQRVALVDVGATLGLVVALVLHLSAKRGL